MIYNRSLCSSGAREEVAQAAQGADQAGAPAAQGDGATRSPGRVKMRPSVAVWEGLAQVKLGGRQPVLSAGPVHLRPNMQPSCSLK